MLSTIRILFFLILISPLAFGVFNSSDVFAYGDIGGDDVIIWETGDLRYMSMDIANNGDIYAAGQYRQPGDLWGIAVYRSQDDGTTWDPWGELTTATGMGDHYSDPSLQVVEGDVEKCFLLYTHSSNLHNPRIMMASSDLAGASGDFSTPTTVMSTPAVSYTSPRFDTDVANYSDFYIYVVAKAGGSGSDIVFARSTDLGVSFEPQYVIGNLIPTDRNYIDPDVSYGFGGFVNVVWRFISVDGSFDSALRFTRAEFSAGAGLAAWNGVHALGSTSDGIEDQNPRIEASSTGSKVVIAHERRSAVKNASDLPDPGIYISTDSGLAYPTSTTIPDGVIFLGDIAEQPGTGNWFVCGMANDGYGIHRSNVADLTSWSALEAFADRDYDYYYQFVADLAFNPAQGFRPAMVWSDFQLDILVDDGLMFDGEWRGDPGYPNLEPGFPVDLMASPRSAPAVVDVNGDGDLEIVFGDSGGNIQIYQDDGTPLPGWPVNIGENLSTGPLAIGDLKNNGEMFIVAGSSTGLVYCYDAQGQMADGHWPYGVPSADPAYVAIGAFGQGPYPRGIIVGTGLFGFFLDHAGGIYPGSRSKNFVRRVTYAPAIGDVDGDGLPEAVFATEEVIVAATIFGPSVTFGRYMPADLSGAPTLGDFDHDGDMEVVVPLENGKLYVLNEDGSDFPGFPFTGSTGSRLSTAAIGQMLGTWEPEIATAARNWTVHVLLWHGGEGTGYPVGTGGWINYGSPIIGRVDGTSSDVVLGSRGQQSWAWANLGSVIPGWPKAAADNFYQAPAMGDIDLDGRNEIVLLSTAQLIVVDVNNSPNDPTRTWAMAGHDPQRTGCADCPEDLVTPVEDDKDTITRVSFAAPWPNPSSGSATFRFAVPGPAVVNLEVFDVRGHRVSLVTREEVDMGHHVAFWGGLGDGGAPVASGVYFARLTVQGPGINETLTRKVTLAR